MKIALVQCPAWTSESPPYALALLAAILKKNEHEVICFDLNIELYRFCKEYVKQDSIINDDSWAMDFRGNVWYEKDKVLNFIYRYQQYIDQLVEAIINSGARVIGFSVQSTSKFFSLEVARKIKEKDKNKIIIFGGPLCFKNCYGIDLLMDFHFLDYVCFGEAEEALPSLLNIIEKNGDVNHCFGFGYCLEDIMVADGVDARPIEFLDKIPFADYYNFPLEKYTKKLLPIATSRGCINRCSFCSESTHWRKYRKRNAQNILGEIKHQLKQHPDIETFWFNDSLINGDMEILNDLCDLLIFNKIKIKWGGQGMVRKEMTEDFLQKMKLAGCTTISYGVEAVSNKILKLMKKNYYTAELAEKVIRDTFKTGINVIFNLIVGFPSETENEFKETKEFLRRCKEYASHVELVTLLLLKGSYLYNNLEEFNITPIEFSDPDWQLKWKTEDNRNTYELRKERLEELRKIIDVRTNP